MLPSGGAVELAGVPFLLDEDYEQKTGRRCYVHGGRTIFAERTDITGKPGSQNLKPELMQWHITDFDGEGQAVFDNDDPSSARLFYRSEGLDFRTSGQVTLNKSIVAQFPEDTTTLTTKQGNADCSDVSGTSTTSGTDRKLVAVTDKIKTSNHTPGAAQVQLDFFLYKQAFSDYATTIQGSAFTVVEGDGETSGTDLKLTPTGSKARSSTLTTADDTHYRCDFYLYAPGGDTYHYLNARVAIVDVTAEPNKSVATYDFAVRGSASVSSANAALTFKAYAGRTYRAYVQALGAGGRGGVGYPTSIAIDQIIYGTSNDDNVARIELYNETTGASVKTKDVVVTANAAGSITGSMVFSGVAATAYSYRVKRNEGEQAIWVDKIAVRVQNAAPWQLDAMDVGYNGKVWLVGSQAGTNSQAWTYDTAADDWEVQANKVSATNNRVCLQLAHSDKFEYALFSNGELRKFTGAAASTNADDGTGLADGTAICVAQDRLFALKESSAGAVIKTYALDAVGAIVNTLSVCSSDRSAVDTTHRQRMVGTPTGARFFVNYGDVRSEVWEVDASQSGLQKRLIAQLDVGVKATAIAYSGGITYIAGQYLGDSTATDNERKPLSGLWLIDQNGVLNRVGTTRRTSTDTNPICFIMPYQNDVYMLQGAYIWRYSIVTGGLFLEYKVDPDNPDKARAITIHKGRVLAMYKDEVWVAGTVGSYRQSSLDGGSRFFTSIYDGGLPGVVKSLDKVRLLTTTLPANTAVKLRYSADGGSYTELATAVQNASNTFNVSDELNPIQFGSIQFEVTLISENGTSTPTLLGIVISYAATDQEEYFDLVLLTEDQDSSFRLADEQVLGVDKAAHIFSLRERGSPFTFIDSYRNDDLKSEYLVRIEDVRDERTAAGEGRTVLTLRVI